MSNTSRRRAPDMESGDGSYPDLMHQQVPEEHEQHQHQHQHQHRQHFQQHARPLAPAPYPASAPPTNPSSYATRATNISAHQQDTLRRRSVATSAATNDQQLQQRSTNNDLDDSGRSESSFRFTGLEMPSTDHNNGLDTSSEHKATRFYNPSHAQQRLNASMSNLGGGGGGGAVGVGVGVGAESMEDPRGGRNTFRRASYQPQRRNARPAKQKQSAAPNRYYIANKNVQITSEWSSPTRKRRSRNTIQSLSSSSSSRNNNNNNNNNNSNSSIIDNNSHSNENILVLPSIIPNGGMDDSFHSHSSSNKPPSLPMRKTCVQATNIFCSIGAFKWCILVQVVIAIPLCLYVFDAHAQKRSAKQQLQQYNEEHEHILNQMMWMDQAAKKMKALHDGAKQGELLESYYSEDGATDELRESVHKLRGQMRDMQYRIQQNSKARITEKYGDGPVRVFIHPEVLERDPLNKSEEATTKSKSTTKEEQTSTPEIAIELFVEETPHAVSTWLYQIERGHWDRVQLNWRGETTILSKPGSTVTSAMGDWAQTSRLEFLEKFPVKHCEVSLVQEGQLGNLSLKINLVEVPFLEQEEVCIGRLINDRLVLPKTRDYFMAQFSTTSILPEGYDIQQQQQVEEIVVQGDKKEVSEDLKGPPPRLRGHQVVPPLEEPGDEAEDGL